MPRAARFITRLGPRWLCGIAAVAVLAASAMIGGCAASTNAGGSGSPRDYPQWRGRARDGEASAFTAPAVWPESLRRRWKVDVGEGHATPLVIGKTVYVFTRREGEEVLTALDADSGQERWHTGYAAAYTPTRPAAAHGAGPKATPLFHEGRLYTVGVSGIVAAFDPANGALLWRTPAPSESPLFSAAASPVGDKGLVIAHPGNYGPLTAFDAKTGDVRWTAGDNGFFASPVIVTLDGVRQVVTMTQKDVIGVSVSDGTLLWHHPWPGGSGGITPILHGQTIIVSALNAGVAAFAPVGRGGTWATNVLWETKDVSMYISTPVVIGDTLFGLSHRASGQFFGIDTRTGKVLWLGQPREAANTAIAKAADLIFLLNDDGELIVARSSRTGFEPLKRYTVADSATWAQPAISGNRLFIKDVRSLTLWTLD